MIQKTNMSKDMFKILDFKDNLQASSWVTKEVFYVSLSILLPRFGL